MASSERIEWTRREFLQAGAVTGLVIGGGFVTRPATQETSISKTPAVIRGAFLYPPSETLEAAGYWSWPGSGFGAEEHERDYLKKLNDMAQRLGVRIELDDKALDTEDDIARFAEAVKANPPDGLLLIAFKKSHWAQVMKIVEQVKLPAVGVAALGTLLSDQITPAREQPGLYLVHSLENFSAMEYGIRMFRAMHRMKENVLLDLNLKAQDEIRLPFLQTRLRTVALDRFYDTFADTALTDEVKRMAGQYKGGAKDIVEPNDDDILQAARGYFALKSLVKAEQADAFMMTCLPGIRRPHKHVPPCMGFMSLRDEGIVAGCQSDLDATLSLMLVQELFGLPGFQQNAGMDTEKNLYFGAHCTCPTRMSGPDRPADAYVLRSHAEAGWGCVPRVLLKPGQDITLMLYQSSERPGMIIYTGKVVDCPECPPAGGCRTNVRIAMDDVGDVCSVKGMHQTVFYGNYGRQLRTFCRTFGIETVC